MKRTTLIKNYISDDVDYTLTLFYAICDTLNISFKQFIEYYNITPNCINDFLYIAEVNHCLPFKRSVEEMIARIKNIDYFKGKEKYSYLEYNNKVGIIRRFVNSMCIKYDLNEYDVIYSVFKYGLADRMIDTRTALCITPSNIVFYEYSDEILKDVKSNINIDN